ncbi:hypothetical protein OSTOST_12810 [Ostertagia ostertagi]
MFFYLVCTLFLLNAFTTEAQSSEPCQDQGGEQFCFGPHRLGFCNKPDFQHIAEYYCAKTCGICH